MWIELQKPEQIHLLLSGLKLIESDQSSKGMWREASITSKLHTALWKQTFKYEKSK